MGKGGSWEAKRVEKSSEVEKEDEGSGSGARPMEIDDGMRSMWMCQTKGVRPTTR